MAALAEATLAADLLAARASEAEAFAAALVADAWARDLEATLADEAAASLLLLAAAAAEVLEA